MTASGRGQPPVTVVTMLDSVDPLSGAETIALETAMRLDAARFDRVFCLTRWNERFEREEPGRTALTGLRSSGVRVLALPRRSRLSILPWLRLIRFLRDEQVDLIHSHKFGSNVWATIFGRLTRVPVVVAHEYVWAFKGEHIRRLLDRRLIGRFSDAFIASSQGTCSSLIREEGVRPGDVVCIPNAIAGLPPGDREQARAQLGIGPEVPVVGTIAALRPQKALDVLVRAAALLRRDWPRLRVLIVGDGPERHRLEGLVADLDLHQTVQLLGYRGDVADLLAGMDVAVCCSDYEGVPLAVLEYMDAALPVVATRVEGLEELFEEGVSGVLVEPRHPAQLAQAISGLLGDSRRRRDIGVRAQEDRRSRYNIDGYVRRIEQLYEDLLHDRAAA